MDDLKSRVLKGTFWAFMERFGLQLVGFGVTVVLSRLLSPNDYGTLALLSIFTCIVGNLVDSGFAQALIQKKDATELEYNSVFWFSCFASILGYLVLFAAAPAVARFYKVPELCLILRVTSISLVFNAMNSVQRAVLTKKMLFHLSFRISLAAAVVAGIVGVALALNGFGPWALVWHSVASGLCSVLMFWWLIGWRPQLMFSGKSLRGLFGFGWKVTASFFVDQLYGNLSGVLIGKFYTRADLAFVDKGRSLPGTVMMAVNGSIERVCYPALAEMQDDPARFKSVLRRMIKTSTFVVFPMMVGLASCADVVIPLLFGEKWIPAVPFMQLVCLQYALRPFHSVNLRAILALGRSDVFIKLEVLKKIVGLALLAVSLPFGVLPFVVVSTVVGDPLCVIINAWPNRKLINYTVRQQVQDVIPSALISGMMGLAILPLNYLPLNRLLILFVQIPMGVVIYFSLAYLFKVDAFEETSAILSDRLPCIQSLKRRLRG